MGHVSTLTAANLAVATLNLLQGILIARWLGPKAYGLAALVMTYPALLYTLFDARSYEAAVKYMSEFNGRGQRERVLAMVKLSYLVDLAIGVLALGAAWVTAGWAERNIVQHSETAQLLVIYSISLLPRAFVGASYAALSVLGRFPLLAGLELATGVLKTIAVLALVLAGFGFRGVVWGNAIATVFTGGLFAACAYSVTRKAWGKSWVTAKITLLKDRGRELFRFFAYNDLIALLGMIPKQLDVVLLGAFRGAADVGYYKLAKSLAGAAGHLAGPLQSVAFPQLAHLWGMRDADALRSKVRTFAMRVGLPLGLAGVLVVPFAGQIIRLLFGEDFLPAVSPAYLLLAASALWLAFFWLRPLYLAIGWIRFWTVLVCLSAIASILSYWLLVPVYGSLGLAAFSLGILIVTYGIALANLGRASPWKSLSTGRAAASSRAGTEGLISTSVQAGEEGKTRSPSRSSQRQRYRLSTRSVCFIGGARYSRPLDLSSAKKFHRLAAIAEPYVIGFSYRAQFVCFREQAHFLLMPRMSLALLRYVERLIISPIVLVWLIFRHHVQIIVAQSPQEGFPAVIAKGLAKCLGRRVSLIVESHGDVQQSLLLDQTVRFPGLLGAVMKRIAKVTVRHADLLRSVSLFTEQLVQRYDSAKPIFRFPAWTDIETFLIAGASRTPLSRTQDVLYAGTLAPVKGIDLLIEAFARIAPGCSRARLVLVGAAANADYERTLRRRAERLGVSDRVHFVGELPQEELARRMAAARVFVLPSRTEGLGRVLIEAMAAGTPVIGSNVGGIPEVIDEGVTGWLVPPGDQAALASRLTRIFEHPEEAADVALAGRKFAQTFFTADKYVQGYAEMFRVAEELLRSLDGVQESSPDRPRPLTERGCPTHADAMV